MVSQISLAAAQLVQPGTVILAADESPGSTMRRRFESVGLDYTPEAAQHYREALFTTPAVPVYCSGVILHPDSLGLLTDCMPTAEYLHRIGVPVGVKLDLGVVPFGTHGESVSIGLEGMAGRLASYQELYAVDFAKARSVFNIGEGTPSREAIEENIYFQIKYAQICLQAGVVPILEPEILANGAHSIQEASATSRAVLARLHEAIDEAGINPAEVIVKTSLVTYGLKHLDYHSMTPDLVAHSTLMAFDELPADLGGIALLSGGHSSERSIEFLQACNEYRHSRVPVTASYGRGLQWPALKAYAADPNNRAAVAVVFGRSLMRCADARVQSRNLVS